MLGRRLELVPALDLPRALLLALALELGLKLVLVHATYLSSSTARLTFLDKEDRTGDEGASGWRGLTRTKGNKCKKITQCQDWGKYPNGESGVAGTTCSGEGCTEAKA